MRPRSIFGVMVATAAALAASAAAGTASAGTTLADATVERQVAFTQPGCVPAETVVLTGTVRNRFRLTETPSGGFHVDTFYAANGRGSGFNVLTDPGLLTPVASYTASDEQIQSMQFPSSGTTVVSVVFNTRVIRQGETVSADDHHLVTRVQFTVSANGVITVDRLEDRMECR